jgi:molybdate/tungstate transport system substrate-binding protein
MENSIGPAFQTATEYTFQGEGHGSLEDAQMIIGGQRFPDIFIGVGKTAMQLLVNHSLVSWWLSFATDQIVIAYSNKSSFLSQLNSAAANQTRWYNVLEQQGFKLGTTDPTIDPKGVYAILMFKLAAIYYSNSILAIYINSVHASTFTEETLPVQLQTGTIDAMIAYKHEAIERHFLYIPLPAQINLGVQSEASYYKQVSTSASGQKSVGGPIIFSVTIPTTVKDQAGALAFVKFIIKGSGQAILQHLGFSLIMPALVGGNASSVPLLS